MDAFLFDHLRSMYYLKELIERHEKGILCDHQLALHKMQQYKQKHMSTAVKSNEGIDQLEHRIVQQEDAIHTMENRNFFSLYCLQMETQLIHQNMDMLVKMLQNLVDIEIRKHTEVIMQPNVAFLLFLYFLLILCRFVKIFAFHLVNEFEFLIPSPPASLFILVS